MVAVVVLGAVGLVVGVGAGALLLVALALSVRAAEVGRRTGEGLPLVGARHAQFGEATAALAEGSQPSLEPALPAEAPSLRLVRPPAGGPDRPQPARAA
ncbi:MAG: hypothetical protein PGN11_06930 [Quadrisphaera sp.]